MAQQGWSSHAIRAVSALLTGVLVGIGPLAWSIFGGVPFMVDDDANVSAVVTVSDQFMRAGERNDPDAGGALVAQRGRTNEHGVSAHHAVWNPARPI